MSNEDFVFLSECLGIHLEELKKIEVPQESIIITSFIDYSSSEMDTPENTELFVGNDTVDQYHYEIHSVEYICQDCGESFSSPGNYLLFLIIFTNVFIYCYSLF